MDEPKLLLEINPKHEKVKIEVWTPPYEIEFLDCLLEKLLKGRNKMKTFVIVSELELSECFIVQGPSIDDPKVREEIRDKITRLQDGYCFERLTDMDREEAVESSTKIKIFEVASERFGGDLFMEAWNLIQNQEEKREKANKEHEERSQRILYNKLKKKFEGK